MAVYTLLTNAEISAFLAQYAVGTLVFSKGIAEGIENTNYLLQTSLNGAPKRYILTVYEQRVSEGDLPYFMALTEWLADRSVLCPRPIRGLDGEAIRTLAGKKAALIEFLQGRGNPHITPVHLRLLGAAMAQMHVAAADFPHTRENSMGLNAWRALFARMGADANQIAPKLADIAASELEFFETHWPKELPRGVIHADLFPDNVFFLDGETDAPVFSGMIDFYFACNEVLAYDLAVVLNAWCFDAAHQFVPARAEALLEGYQKVRPLLDAETQALGVLARAAALRFLATRSFDWLNRVEGALVTPKNPLEYVAKLEFWMNR